MSSFILQLRIYVAALYTVAETDYKAVVYLIVVLDRQLLQYWIY